MGVRLRLARVAGETAVVLEFDWLNAKKRAVGDDASFFYFLAQPRWRLRRLCPNWH
jgi:hypothetical protein